MKRGFLQQRRSAAMKLIGEAMAVADDPNFGKMLERAQKNKPNRLRGNNMRRNAYFKKRMEKWNAPPENAL